MTIKQGEHCQQEGPDAVARGGVSTAAPRAGAGTDNPDPKGLPLAIRLLDIPSPELMTDNPNPATGLFVRPAPPLFVSSPCDLTHLHPIPTDHYTNPAAHVFAGGPKRLRKAHRDDFTLFWTDQYAGRLAVGTAGWCIYRFWDTSPSQMVRARPKPELCVMEFPAYHSDKGHCRIRAAMRPDLLVLGNEAMIERARASLQFSLGQDMITTRLRYEDDNQDYAARRRNSRK